MLGKFLLFSVICFMATSCRFSPTHFVCYLSEIDTYLTVTKGRGVTDIVFSNKPGVTLISDSVDYVHIEHLGTVYILYDPDHIKNLYLMCYAMATNINTKYYNMEILSREEFNGSKFRQQSDDPYPDFLPNYRWVCINLDYFSITTKGKVLKKGNVFSGFEYEIPDTLICVP